MKKTIKLFGIIVLAAVMTFSLIFTACSNGTTGSPGGSTTPDPQDVTYVSYDGDGNKYELVITDKAKAAKAIRAAYNPKNGDNFVLTITNIMGDIIGKSTGSVTIESIVGSSITFTLTSKDETVFSVTVSSNSNSSGSDGKIDVIKADNGIPNELEGGQPIPAPAQTDLTDTPVTPDDLPAEKRWSMWVASDSTATVDHFSVNSEGVCTVTVGGVPMSNNSTDGWKAWKVLVNYIFTAKANTLYTYKFEAWTDPGEQRNFYFEWYSDLDLGIYRSIRIPITSTRTTYTVRGEITKGGVRGLYTQLADELGTVHMKILSIDESTPELEYELINNGTAYRIKSAAEMKNAVDIHIPATYNGKPVTEIANGAFSDCARNLTSVTIPASVTSIGEWAFRECTGLTNIIVDSGNPIYTGDGRILYNKDKTELVAYPSASGSVTIPSNVTRINYSAFEGCTNLTSINIHANVTWIGSGLFAGCSNLTSITVDAGNPYYTGAGGILYNRDKTELIAGATSGTVTIPTSVTTIGWEAFRSCGRLTGVIIPTSVTSIGGYAFGWSGITSITIPSSVTQIGYGAFAGCDSLQTINVPFTSPATADAAWGSGWRHMCNAQIVYQP